MLGYFHYQIKFEPMENHEIQTVLMNALSLQEVHVSGDGSHFQVIAVGEMFDGMSRVKKQQAVYAPLMEYIADNRIHVVPPCNASDDEVRAGLEILDRALDVADQYAQ